MNDGLGHSSTKIDPFVKDLGLTDPLSNRFVTFNLYPIADKREVMGKRAVIIVAGGVGARFGSPIPKQFMLLHGEPILAHTVRAFLEAVDGIIIVVVTHPDFHTETALALKLLHIPAPKLIITSGGATRFLSSKAGMDALLKSKPNFTGVVGIHDAARPLVSFALIERCYAMAEETGAAIPAIPVQDSLRRIPTQGGHYPVDRGFYRAVQTPQCFDATQFNQAISQAEATEWLDDATMYEAAGFGVTLVTGEVTNLKITTAFDLQIAEALMVK